ncbi:arylamine N-acetyltransferase [Flavobacterium sp. HXWNR69]|uniref:Arylamine N-acetyltransferase n=1 Tax=Flavobacterium fragile TaxID=2949085 RepID=A0ABT0THR3_9FLAO|nr:arylamine N-acetyltransferase [Flavobacterium sp. HXWNR69]MCL9770373.1 arylamine N-acetyltransferase [Flavobacterium sp. HXWNR69]
MSTLVSLKSYFERIGFCDVPQVNLETLQQLTFLHVTTIPFENLNPIFKKSVPIDITSVSDKIIASGRGGYCFEQNTLFYKVLKQIGFEVIPLSARVVWNKSDDAFPAKTHLFLKVVLNNEVYLIDVGFGAQSLTHPIPFVLHEVHQTSHETIRIIKKDLHFVMQTLLQNEWKSMYKFTIEKQYFVDFEVANWYTSTHPNHIFTNILTVARADQNCRYSLVDNKFSTYFLDGKVVSEQVTSVAELKNILIHVFKIQLPEWDNLDEQFALIVTKP